MTSLSYPFDSAALLRERRSIRRELLADRLALEKFAREVLRPGVRVDVTEAARELGVVERLQALDIEVVSWGPLLTDVLRNNEKLITI